MTKAMTPIQTIEHLETLLSAATEGPWIVSGGRQSSLTLGRDVQLHTIGPDGDGVAVVFYDTKTGLGFSDAKLIVAMRNELPALLAAMRETLEENAWQPIESAPKDGTLIWLTEGTRSGGAIQARIRLVVAKRQTHAQVQPYPLATPPTPPSDEEEI